MWSLIIFCISITVSLNVSAQVQENIGENRLRRVSELLGIKDCTSALAVLDTMTFDENIAPHYFYFRGVAEDMCGNKSSAQSYFEKSLNEFDKYDYKDGTYLDASLRLIDFCRSNDHSSQRMAELARNALSAPKDVLDNYANTYAIYECYHNSPKI